MKKYVSVSGEGGVCIPKGENLPGVQNSVCHIKATRGKTEI